MPAQLGLVQKLSQHASSVELARYLEYVQINPLTSFMGLLVALLRKALLVPIMLLSRRGTASAVIAGIANTYAGERLLVS